MELEKMFKGVHALFVKQGIGQKRLKSVYSWKRIIISQAFPLVRNSGRKLGLFDVDSVLNLSEQFVGHQSHGNKHIHVLVLPLSIHYLKVWQTRFKSLGGNIIESFAVSKWKAHLLHVLAASETALSKLASLEKLKRNKKMLFVKYDWIEDCLKEGKLLSCTPYIISEVQEQFSQDSSVKKLRTEGLEKVTEDIQASAHSSAGIHLPPQMPDECAAIDGSAAGIELEQRLLITYRTTDITAQEQKEWQLTWGFDPPNLNKHVTGQLAELWHIYEDVLGDEWRALTYRKATNRIEKLPFKISSAEELKHLQGIGKSMIEKVKEILLTGQLKKLENLKADPKVHMIQHFASVWGIGAKLAHKFYQSGCQSLEELEREPSLTTMARLGLKYHHDIKMRIPREEVTEVESFVQPLIQELCAGALLTVGGSYRRGQATCGDIDLLITHPDGQSQEGLMAHLLDNLRKIGFLVGYVGNLAAEGDNRRVQSCMGICRLPHHPHHRRIDIKIYPMDSYPFALIYFTGNDVLNRRIRFFARTKGYKLSDQGLFLRVGNEKNEKFSHVSLPCRTEQEVFERLGLKYPEPYDRNW